MEIVCVPIMSKSTSRSCFQESERILQGGNTNPLYMRSLSAETAMTSLNFDARDHAVKLKLDSFQHKVCPD